MLSSLLHIACKVHLSYPWTCVFQPWMRCTIHSNNAIIFQGYLLMQVDNTSFPAQKERPMQLKLQSLNGHQALLQLLSIYWRRSVTTTKEREYILRSMSVKLSVYLQEVILIQAVFDYILFVQLKADRFLGTFETCIIALKMFPEQQKQGYCVLSQSHLYK